MGTDSTEMEMFRIPQTLTHGTESVEYGNLRSGDRIYVRRIKHQKSKEQTFFNKQIITLTNHILFFYKYFE